LRGKRFASESDHFHGTDDAARVLAINLCKRCRIERLQLTQQICERRGFECGAQLFIGRRRVAESIEESLEVKSRAAAENRHAMARLDFRRGLTGEFDKPGRVEGFFQIHDVNQVMWHAGALGGGRFGGADVEAAINLHGIHRDDFAADCFGEQQRDFGFANGGRAGEEDGSLKIGRHTTSCHGLLRAANRHAAF
jgi:hypothetical protein